MERKLTVAFIAIAVLALAGAFAVQIDDNPPGVALCYAAATSLVVAFVHRWRRPKPFAFLLVASLIGFVVFAVLHNLLYAEAQLTDGTPWLAVPLEFLNAAAFLVAIFLCPAGVVVGAVGLLVALVRKRRSTITM